MTNTITQLKEVREALQWYADEGFQQDVIDVGSCGVAATYESDIACAPAISALTKLDAVIAQMGWQPWPQNQPRMYEPLLVSHPLLFCSVQNPEGEVWVHQGYYHSGDECFYVSGDSKKLPWKHTVVSFMHYDLPTGEPK